MIKKTMLWLIVRPFDGCWDLLMTFLRGLQTVLFGVLVFGGVALLSVVIGLTLRLFFTPMFPHAGNFEYVGVGFLITMAVCWVLELGSERSDKQITTLRGMELEKDNHS